MRELAVVRGRHYKVGETVEVIYYHTVNRAGETIDDEFNQYVLSDNFIAKEFYTFELVSPKQFSEIGRELELIGQGAFVEDVTDWLTVSRPMFRDSIVEWFAVYEIEQGYDYAGTEDYYRNFYFLGRLDEINIEVLPIDIGDN